MKDPLVLAYGLTSVVLALNLMALWAYSGAVRFKSKTAINVEDPGTLVAEHPPEVARVLRAHANAMANIVPFALLGIVMTFAAPSLNVARGLFFAFAAFRIAHSVAYLFGKQPWRTIFFAGGFTVLLAMLGYDGYLLLS